MKLGLEDPLGDKDHVAGRDHRQRVRSIAFQVGVHVEDGRLSGAVLIPAGHLNSPQIRDARGAASERDEVQDIYGLAGW